MVYPIVTFFAADRLTRIALCARAPEYHLEGTKTAAQPARSVGRDGSRSHLEIRAFPRDPLSWVSIRSLRHPVVGNFVFGH